MFVSKNNNNKSKRYLPTINHGPQQTEYQPRPKGYIKGKTKKGTIQGPVQSKLDFGLGYKPESKVALWWNLDRNYDPKKHDVSAPQGKKFFFPKYFVHDRAQMLTTPLVHRNWLAVKRVVKAQPGYLNADKLFTRRSDEGALQSRWTKERYEDKKDQFGIGLKTGVPVKKFAKGTHKLQYGRIDYSRTSDNELDVFHKKFQTEEGAPAPEDVGNFPHDDVSTPSIHSSTSSEGEKRKKVMEFIDGAKKVEEDAGVTKISQGKEWFAIPSAMDYRPGYGDLLRKPKKSNKEDPPVSTFPKLDSSSESDSQEEPEGRLSIVSILSSLSDDIPGPTVPPSKPKPKKGPNDIDFLLKNALQTVRMPPKRPVPYYIDDVRGSRHPYCTSGLERMFVYKEDFGKIPQYLQERNVELGRPAVPDFRKFYQNHDCKFYHRHVHCKKCKRIRPVDSYGMKMYRGRDQMCFGPYPCPDDGDL